VWMGDSVLSAPAGTLVRFPRGAMLRGIALQPSCHGETVTATDQRRRVHSMRQYELMVILDPELDDRTVAPSLEKFLTVVTKDKGTVDNVDIWGRRRLAYDIKKKSEGIYAVVNFTAEPATAKELDRQLGLNESVMRTKLLRPGA
jgi:small subunit ribosomal protein S6